MAPNSLKSRLLNLDSETYRGMVWVLLCGPATLEIYTLTTQAFWSFQIFHTSPYLPALLPTKNLTLPG